MKNLVKIFWLSELVLAMLIILGVADATMAYISLFVLLLGVWKLSDLDALLLYIFSIPIFVALPSNFLSESMSVWRFAVLFFALKIFVEKFELLSILKNKGLTLADRKAEIISNFKVFFGDVKTSNYYGILYPTLLFGAVSFLSLIFAESLGVGIKKIIFLGSVFVLFGIVSFAVKNKNEAMKVLKAIFATGVGIMFVGYAQLASTFFITLYDFWGLWNNYVIEAFYGERTMVLLSYSNTWFSYYDPDGDIPPTLRIFSVMPDSHSFSMLMILFAPLALFYFYASKSKTDKRKNALIFILLLLAIFFSGSRGAWVGWLGALAATLYFYFSPKLAKRFRILEIKDYVFNKKIYKTTLVAVMLFVVLFPVSSFVLRENQDSQLIREGREVTGERRNSLLQRTLSISDMDETSNKGRIEIWRDSLVSVTQHPIVGIGMGNFPLALSEKVTTSKMGASAHNIYLDVAVELGIVGLIIFLLLLFRLLEKLFLLTYKFQDRNLRFFAFSFLVFSLWIFTYGFFDVVILNDKVLMFFVIILALFYKLENLEGKESFSGVEIKKS
ncbi:MAG: O-antigen ligase family protein [Candidatus Paceibacterota bacterium]